METIQQVCSTCAGMGKVVNWQTINKAEGLREDRKEM